MKKLLSGVLATGAVIALASAPATAATGYTLFGEASTYSPGNGSATAIKTVSDSDPGWGGIDYEVSAGLTFGTLNTLSTDFNVTDDNCGAGSPRFQINVDTGSEIKNIFAYLGTAPGYDTCVPNTWVSSGDLLETPNFVDTSQLGGTFYDSYANAVTNYGSYTVVGIQLVTDSGWNATASGGDGEQTVLFDNTMVNSMLYNYEPQLVTVTIDKYINGSMATASSANNSAFPMESTWDADNIGAGSGTYSLSPVGFNSPNAYEAITSEMTMGADYMTHEVTGGSVVASSCTPNGAPFALVGYTTGNTLAEAQAGTPSLTMPTFTDMQGDKFVIVWNKTCSTPTTKDQCKKDGWKNYGYFKNQGDCVSYMATGGRNIPAF